MSRSRSRSSLGLVYADMATYLAKLYLLLGLVMYQDVTSLTCGPPAVKQTCEKDWMVKSVKGYPPLCLFKSDTAHSWNESRELCQSKGGADLMVEARKGLVGYANIFLFAKQYNIVWLGLVYTAANKWHWGHGPPGTKETLYRQWKTYPTTTVKECSALQPFENGWQPMGCTKTDKAFVMCHKNATGGVCPGGWTEVATNECVFLHKDKKNSFQDGIDMCKKDQAGLLHIKTNSMQKAVMEYFKPYHTAWIGLTDEEEEDKWRWTSGATMISADGPNWGLGEPHSDATKNCAFVDIDRKWKVQNCEEEAQAFCFKDKRVGPGHTRMDIEYHMYGGVFFLDEPITVSCTAVGAENNAITWNAYRGIFDVTLPTAPAITLTKGVQQNDGVCVNWTTSTLPLHASVQLNNTQLSCFAVPPSPPKACRRFSDGVRPCDVSKTFKIIDGPKGPPHIEVEYIGYPGPIKLGVEFNITCTVNTGPAGILKWVTNNAQDIPNQVFGQTDTGVAFYRKTSNTQYVSRLSESMISILDGFSFSCFAYKPRDDQPVPCLKTNKYCVKSPKLKLWTESDEPKPPMNKTMKYWWVIVVGLLALVGLGLWTKIPLKEGEGEGRGKTVDALSRRKRRLHKKVSHTMQNVVTKVKQKAAGANQSDMVSGVVYSSEL